MITRDEALIILRMLYRQIEPCDQAWDEVNDEWEAEEPEQFIEECETTGDYVNDGHDLVVNPEYKEWRHDRKQSARAKTLKLYLEEVIE